MFFFVHLSTVIFCRYRLHFLQDAPEEIARRKAWSQKPFRILPEVKLIELH